MNNPKNEDNIKVKIKNKLIKFDSVNIYCKLHLELCNKIVLK